MRTLLPLAFLFLAACSGKEKAADNTAAAASTARPQTIPLIITANGKPHRFDVEVALTAEEQAKGLMFRKDLGTNAGMVFPMSPPRTASFWMKNMFIPIDMLFIHTDGTVAMVAANAQPYSREPISAGVPVAGVVELRAGRAAELGIREGAKVRWGNCSAPSRPDEAWDQLNFCPD